jgi:hypothetical protein
VSANRRPKESESESEVEDNRTAKSILSDSVTPLNLESGVQSVDLYISGHFSASYAAKGRRNNHIGFHPCQSCRAAVPFRGTSSLNASIDIYLFESFIAQ